MLRAAGSGLLVGWRAMDIDSAVSPEIG